MNINDINVLVNILIKVVLAILGIIGVIRVYKFYTTKYIDIKNKEITNEKIKLYSAIDARLVKQELINLISDYTARYITKNFMVNGIDFIKDDQMDKMTKDIVREVILEMSDLYLSYCKLLYKIENEDDLINAIYYLTIDVVLNAVREINKDKS